MLRNLRLLFIMNRLFIRSKARSECIIYYLETVILHVVLNEDVCAYGSPQYFDVLDGEHIESKIMRNVLKVWVSL